MNTSKSLVLFALALLSACAPAAGPSDGASSMTDAAAQSETGAPATDSGTPTTPSAACMEYCQTAAAHCDGTNALYPSNDRCLAACALFPTTGARGDRAGNSVWCRLYHVDQPAAMDPATHCPHAGPSGGGVCQ